MTRKWKVWKRDGAWWVLDGRGRLRYASGNHMMALSFALTRPPKPMPFVTLNGSDLGKSFEEIMREVLERRQGIEDDE